MPVSNDKCHDRELGVTENKILGHVRRGDVRTKLLGEVS